MNRMGIGAQLTVRSLKGARLGFQEIATGYGYASGQPALAHFGLGKNQRVMIEVRFPDGKKIQLQNVAANQRLLIKEK